MKTDDIVAQPGDALPALYQLEGEIQALIHRLSATHAALADLLVAYSDRLPADTVETYTAIHCDNVVRHSGPPAMARASALFVMGKRRGRVPVMVECHIGGMVLLQGEPPTTWEADGSIIDKVATAMCVGHWLLAERPGVQS